MSLHWTDLVGIAAGACTTAAVVPQLVKAVKTKQVKDVSLGMFIVLITGVSLWTVYGFLKNDLAIIIANGISVILNALLLYFMLRYSSKKRECPKS